MGNGMEGGDAQAPEDVVGSLTLLGAVSLGTGVMIGAGIFALIGQVAALAGDLFPIAFLVAAVVVAFSAYSYVKLSNAFPSSGGVAMFLRETYGPGTATGVFALLMYVSMVVSESLVARTFGAYVLQIVNLEPASFWVPTLGVVLLAIAYAVNIAGNRAVQASQGVMAAIKVGGLALFGIVGLWFVTSTNFTSGSGGTEPIISGGFLAGVALAILAYKGFTTITNSGGEIIDPHRNTGRAIVVAIAISAVLYIGLAVMVAGNLNLAEIVAAQNFALAEAARPAFEDAGVWFTVLLAVVATSSGVMASVFAASRMLAMLTRMTQVPHRHFGMPGTIRTHAMVYTVAFAMVLTVLFDLQRIAALGAIFYLIMDIAIHLGGPPPSPISHRRKAGDRGDRYFARRHRPRRIPMDQGISRPSRPDGLRRRHHADFCRGTPLHVVPHRQQRQHGYVRSGSLQFVALASGRFDLFVVTAKLGSHRRLDLVGKVVPVTRIEPPVEDSRQNRGRYTLLHGTQHSPSALTRIRNATGKPLQLGVLNESHGGQIEQPGCYDAAPAPHFGHLWDIKLILVVLGSA